MTDVWDIAAYVEDHPDDYPQRWRLAKKLYAEREYRLALDHLLVLHNAWTPRLNVERYLAATYYRLGRYAESEERLRKSIAQWPDEVGPMEQLAHVLQVDGEYKQSLEVWRQVLILDADHAVAAEAIESLEAVVDGESDKAGHQPAAGMFAPELLEDQEDELQISGRVCARCGAQNSDEFEACWQCGADLRKETPSFLNTPPLAAHGPYLLRPETMTAMAAMAIVLMLLVSLALGIRLGMIYINRGDSPLSSTRDLGSHVLFPARAAAGMVMFLFWPFAIKLVLNLFRTRPYPPTLLVYVSGFFVGALTLLLVMMPMPFPMLAFFAALLVSLALTVFALRIYLNLALAVWITHIVLVMLSGALTFWLVESYRYGELINPLSELPAVSAAVVGPEKLHDATYLPLPTTEAPYRKKVLWRSSGSSWLDAHASKIDIRIHIQRFAENLRFQIYQGGDLRYHHDLEGRGDVAVEFAVFPGQEYEFAVLGATDANVQVNLRSLLPFTFIQSD